MSVSASFLRAHLDYTAWASRLLLDAAARLTPAELSHDFQTADRTVTGTLAHIFNADRLWLGRLTGASPTVFIRDADRDLGFLQSAWPALLERWKDWAAGLTDEQALQPVDYTDLQGLPCTLPLWQIVFPMVNHGTHHRGQAAGFLRALGHQPPALDMVYFFRRP